MSINFGNVLFNTFIAFRDTEFQPQELVKPVITLIGNGVTINQGDTFVEPGYTATDETDGDITANVVVTGAVDTNIAGTYTLRYNVTNSVGNSATELIRIVTVNDFWEYIPPQNRILSAIDKNVYQDKDAHLTYWLDFSDSIGDQSIVAYTIDPDNVLADLTIDCSGFNTVMKTDNLGKTYQAGSLLGFCIRGGIKYKRYEMTIRFTLTGGDIDDRTINIHCTDK